jgi:hypothetical protein
MSNPVPTNPLQVALLNLLTIGGGYLKMGRDDLAWGIYGVAAFFGVIGSLVGYLLAQLNDWGECERGWTEPGLFSPSQISDCATLHTNAWAVLGIAALFVVPVMVGAAIHGLYTAYAGNREIAREAAYRECPECSGAGRIDRSGWTVMCHACEGRRRRNIW